MKMKHIWLLASSILIAHANFGQNREEIAKIEFMTEELNDLIRKDARVEILAEGFEFTEGPYWVKKPEMLLFSDIPANKVYKWTEENGTEVYLDPGGYTESEPRGGFLGPNGIIQNKKGELLICQHGDRRIAKMDAPLDAPEPVFVTVAGKYNGKRLNSPNDLTLSKKGNLYFTDPSYGFEKGPGDPKKELSFQGVFIMGTDGEVRMLLDSIEQPNGIAFFPGEKQLLISNTDPQKHRWYSYSIDSDGNLTDGKVFFDAKNAGGMGGCDGLKIDKKGYVFATGPGGVFIFNPAGEQIGKISVYGVSATNCALSPDEKTLYVTAQQYILRLKMR